MRWNGTEPAGVRDAVVAPLVWLAFAAALVLATAPVWSRVLFGFNPTLDQLLQVMCVAPR